MNTPDILSNSLSVVGALILGDFAVGVGWLCEDVILYMAFVAIANFAQQNTCYRIFPWNMGFCRRSRSLPLLRCHKYYDIEEAPLSLSSHPI